MERINNSIKGIFCSQHKTSTEEHKWFRRKDDHQYYVTLVLFASLLFLFVAKEVEREIEWEWERLKDCLEC